MTLKLVTFLDYAEQYTDTPPQRQAVLQTDHILSIVPSAAQGIGPLVEVKLINGDTFVCLGKPADFAEDPQQ
jgi:hypothetical protein